MASRQWNNEFVFSKENNFFFGVVLKKNNPSFQPGHSKNGRTELYETTVNAVVDRPNPCVGPNQFDLVVARSEICQPQPNKFFSADFFDSTQLGAIGQYYGNFLTTHLYLLVLGEVEIPEVNVPFWLFILPPLIYICQEDKMAV